MDAVVSNAVEVASVAASVCLERIAFPVVPAVCDCFLDFATLFKGAGRAVTADFFL
jgi:hypothetical protein